MLFTFFIAIVFIAELIIALSILLNLIRLDKAVTSLNETLELSKSGIRDISILIRKLSAQVYIFTDNFVANLEQKRDEIILRRISGILLGFLFFRRFRKTKFVKTISKGLSLLQIVV